MAWLSGYLKRKKITLTGGASGAQTDFQLKLAVSYEAAMQGDFDDLRFTQADGETLVDAWAEVIVADTSATVWVKFPTTPANTVTEDYYMYYGNNVVSDWDIEATFLFGDDFSGDLSKWTTIGTPTISAGVLTLNQNAGIWATDYDVDINVVMEGNVKVDGCDDNGHFGLKTSADRFGGHTTVAPKTILVNWCNSSISNLRLAVADGTTNGGMPWVQDPIDTNYNNWRIDFVSGVSSKGHYNDVTLELTNYIPLIADNLHPTIWNYNDQDDANILVNNIFVRKYAANPPTYEFGSERETSIRMVYQGGFNTYKFNSVQIILEDVIVNATWYYNMLKRRNQ